MPTTNTLYYGDNLDILREHIPDESVDLIYLDPPFNSNRSYNVLFREANGTAADSQIAAFDDSWHWTAAAEATLHQITATAPPHVVEMINAIVSFVGRNDVSAYLVMMTIRLVELHRVLKPTGSIYLHCDPTASHYLKVVMDSIFGVPSFRNEIVWKRQSAHSDAKTKFADVADVVLFYAKSADSGFYPQYTEHDPEYVARFYRFDDGDGRGPYRLDNMASPNPRPNMMYEWKGYACPAKGWRYEKATMARLDAEGRIYYPKTKDGRPDFSKRLALKRYLREQQGSIVTNVWTDIPPLHSSAAERLGYPTQKPLALLERIINASSNPGDLVLDPFCGCGTTICAAQKLGRRWIGIDVTHLAIALMRQRLDDMFGEAAAYEVVGQPADLASAEHLARADRYQFQWWALSLIKARPTQDGKKGADQGIDGVLYFHDEAKKPPKKVVVQVKSGHVQSSYVRDLRAVVEREKGVMGFLVSLERPTQPMVTEALSAGFYHSPGWGRDYPVLQIRTIEQLLAGEWFEYPQANVTLNQAERVREEGEQGTLL